MRGGGTISRPTQDVEQTWPAVRLRAIPGGIALSDSARATAMHRHDVRSSLDQLVDSQLQRR